MSSENEIKPGMLVLWTGGRGGQPLPMKDFLGFVVAELSESWCAATGVVSRRFLVFVRTFTTQDKMVIPVFEHRIVSFSKEG